MVTTIYPHQLKNVNQSTCAKILNTSPYHFMLLLLLLILLLLGYLIHVGLLFRDMFFVRRYHFEMRRILFLMRMSFWLIFIVLSIRAHRLRYLGVSQSKIFM